MRTLMVITLAIALLGCAHHPPQAPESPAGAMVQGVGYSQVGDIVTLEFDPTRFENATHDFTGGWKHLSMLTITTVDAAGEFNGWSKSAWPMERAGTRWVLRKPRAEFGTATTYQFKYVINGEWWVEPPRNAANQQGTGFVNNASNLVLILK